MRRVLVLLLYFVGSLLLGNTTSAWACSYERRSDGQLFAKASAVFIAHVVRTEETTGVSPLSDKPEPLVEATFRLVETLKGRPPPDLCRKLPRGE